MSAAAQRLSAAKLWLTAAGGGDAAYLAVVVFALPVTLTTDVEGLEADDRWRLYAHPDWLETTDVPAIGVELAHLCWHLLRDHAGRARSLDVGRREASSWRLAADATVAQTLEAAGHGAGGLRDPVALGLPPDRSVEEYYAMLTRLSVADDEGSDEEPAEGGCGSAADGQTRPHEPADTSLAMEATRAEELRRAVAIEFRGHMRTIGTEPGEWARWVDSVLDPRLPWEQVLAATVRRSVAWASGDTEQTYRRRSRRAAASPQVVLPGLRRPTPSVAVVVDTSGSMDDGLLAQALGEVDGVLRALGPVVGELTVLSCDAAVHTVERSTSGRDVRLFGGGGTDVSPGIHAATRLRPAPEVVVVLTDGWTPWPAEAPERCIVIAAVLGRAAQALPPTPEWTRRVECVLD